VVRGSGRLTQALGAMQELTASERRLDRIARIALNFAALIWCAPLSLAWFFGVALSVWLQFLFTALVLACLAGAWLAPRHLRVKLADLIPWP